MTVLVVGVEHVDSGKTTFSTGLVAHAGAVGFKPRAGNDAWLHHDDYLRCVEDGRLYGKDARRLAAASPGNLDPEDVNPVHRLWRPTPGRTGLLGQEGRMFVLDRAGEQFVVNDTVDVPEQAANHLPLADAIRVETVEELNEVISAQHLSVLDQFAGTVQSTERAVVESYADVARPVHGLDPAVVVVVEPTRARLFDGERFLTGCDIATGGSSPLAGRLEERVSAVLELVDAVETYGLDPLTAEKRNDPAAVADAYEPVYDRVVEMAGW